MSKRAGSTWRVLAQGPGKKRFEARVANGREADSIGSAEERGADFDELVVDGWFHIERMNTRTWWMRVYANRGDDLIVWVDVDKDGRAKRISVTREEAVFTPENLKAIRKKRGMALRSEKK